MKTRTLFESFFVCVCVYATGSKRKCCFVLLQSVLGKMNEIAKHKAAIEDAETQNKVGLHSHSAFVCDVTEKLSPKIHESINLLVFGHMCPERSK